MGAGAAIGVAVSCTSASGGEAGNGVGKILENIFNGGAVLDMRRASTLSAAWNAFDMML